jgi:hypothetical protein
MRILMTVTTLPDKSSHLHHNHQQVWLQSQEIPYPVQNFIYYLISYVENLKIVMKVEYFLPSRHMGNDE